MTAADLPQSDSQEATGVSTGLTRSVLGLKAKAGACGTVLVGGHRLSWRWI